MPADLMTKIVKRLDPAMCRFPKEVIQCFFCISFIIHVKDETKLFLKKISSIQAFVARGDSS